MLKNTRQSNKAISQKKYVPNWKDIEDNGCIICGKVTSYDSIYCFECIKFGKKYKTNS